MAKIRVLFCSFQSNLSGAPRMLYHIAKSIDKQRFELCVLFNYEGPIVDEFRQITETCVLPQYRKRWLPPRIKGVLRSKSRRDYFTQVMRKFQPDIIYLNTIGKGESAEMSLKSDKTPIIVHFHEIDNSVMDSSEIDWIHRLTERSSTIIGCAEAVSEFISRCIPRTSSKVLTVPESIDLCKNDVSQRLPREITKKQLGLTPETLLVGSVGKPSFRKGVDLFIEAAAQIIKSIPEMPVHFIWVGGHEGIHRSSYMQSMYSLVERKGLADRFHWIKELPDASAYQNAMDIYIVPSREDPLPLSMLEAMLLGVPVVGFAVSGVPEALSGGAGVLVEYVHPDALASVIQDVLRNPALRQTLGKKGMQRVRDNHDIQRNVLLIEEAIEQTVKGVVNPR